MKKLWHGSKLCNSPWLTAIDVSQYQGNINWKKVKKSKIDFAYIRSNAGLNEDDLLKQNCNRAKKNNIPFGLYVYIKPEEDVVAQMRLVLNNHKKYGATLVPQIDIEHAGDAKPKVLKQIVKTCIQMATNELCKPPAIYTYAVFWNAHVAMKLGVSQCPLWVARYVYYSDAEFKAKPVPKNVSLWADYAFASKKIPPPVKGWADWDAWQFAGNYDHAGKKFGMTSAHLDLNIVKKDSYKKFVL
jgi:GH25 family lysozyme M1 (1,4-beta-N-acetylmuramidase)